MSKIQIGIIGFVVLIATVLILLFIGVIPGLKEKPGIEIPKIELSLLGFKGDEASLQEVIRAYTAKNPAVLIRLSTVDEARYEENLIENLASLSGPDMFVFPSDWLSRHENKIVPAPATFIDEAKVAEIFPKVVGDDFVLNGQVYALPLFINTLGLIYNRDIFDAKQIVSPPETWDAIKGVIPKVREFQSGKLSKSAISIGGTSKSVQNAEDILALLMIQEGGIITDAKTKVSHFEKEKALDAFKFYMDFSDPKSKSYTLDDSFKNSIDVFVDGTSAMIFAYPDDVKVIKAKNPRLNFRILPMPQLDPNNIVNLADYWGIAVSKMSKNPNLAWNFINFAATDSEAVSAYVASSGNAPALRSAITNYAENPVLKVFAPQVLSAVSWPKLEAVKVREILNSMIEFSLRDRANFEKNFDEAALKIGNIIRK